MIERPEYLNKIISKKENGMIKVITGIRRSGKSFLLTDIYIPWTDENGIYYIGIEDFLLNENW